MASIESPLWVPYGHYGISSSPLFSEVGISVPILRTPRLKEASDTGLHSRHRCPTMRLATKCTANVNQDSHDKE